jgi:hypothetical protein
MVYIFTSVRVKSIGRQPKPQPHHWNNTRQYKRHLEKQKNPDSISPNRAPLLEKDNTRRVWEFTSAAKLWLERKESLSMCAAYTCGVVSTLFWDREKRRHWACPNPFWSQTASWSAALRPN